MPRVPLKSRLILAHKSSSNLKITEVISVPMVMVNNWLLTAKRHEHQDIQCRDPKSNNLIIGCYKCVLSWPYRGILHSLKYIKNAVC